MEKKSLNPFLIKSLFLTVLVSSPLESMCYTPIFCNLPFWASLAPHKTRYLWCQRTNRKLLQRLYVINLLRQLFYKFRSIIGAIDNHSEMAQVKRQVINILRQHDYLF